MNKFLTVFIIFFSLFRCNFLYAQWTICPDGPYTTVNNCFINLGNRVFVGTNSIGVYTTTNAGTNWYPANNGLGNWGIYALGKKNNMIFAGTNQGVWRSLDSGNTWTDVNFGLTNTAVTCFEKVDSIMTTGTYGGGVFISTDNGNYWYGSNINLSNLTIKALKAKDSLLFAGTYGGGVFLSTDRGFTWAARNTGLPDVYVSSLATVFNDIYVSIYNRGVYKSTNRGASWTGASSGLGTFNVLSLASDYNNLYAATETGGIFISTNGGTSWAAINTGIDPSHYYINAIGFNDTYVFCAPYQEPVYKRPKLQVQGINDVSSLISESFRLYDNYPNPFNPQTTIKFDVIKTTELLLQIYDIKGRLISEPVNGIRNAGSYSVNFNGSNLTSGIYFYRLSAKSNFSEGSLTQTKKMLLIK